MSSELFDMAPHLHGASRRISGPACDPPRAGCTQPGRGAARTADAGRGKAGP
jgi:hypothetical protein